MLCYLLLKEKMAVEICDSKGCRQRPISRIFFTT